MIEDYCNQTAVWKHVIDSNAYNEPVYGAPVSIKCRKEQKIRLVRNKNGEQVVSDTRLYTTFPVQIDDLIDERVVISVIEMSDLEGQAEGYEVVL
jgi:hypothetical protein